MTREDLYYDEYFNQWELSSEELDEFEKESYNKALNDLLDRIDLMFLYKDTNGVFHSASYANLNRKSIHAVVEQLKK